MGTIAKQLRKRLAQLRDEKVVSLDAVRQAKSFADELRATRPESTGALDPAHGLYVSVINTVSELFSSLQHLPEMAPFVKTMERTLDEFAPFDQFGPPATPITRTFFNGWAFLDLNFGRDKETVGSIIADLVPLLPLDGEWVKVLQTLNKTRMGLYEYAGNSGDGLILLRELLTHQEFHCRTPLRYRGVNGELWLVRLLPPPSGLTSHHVIFNTPYVFSSTEKMGWLACLKRLLPKTKLYPPEAALNAFFKQGFDRTFWVEYVFEAYTHHGLEFCGLTGFPDIPLSRPHSRGSAQARDKMLGIDQDPVARVDLAFRTLMQNGMSPEEIPGYLTRRPQPMSEA